MVHLPLHLHTSWAPDNAKELVSQNYGYILKYYNPICNIYTYKDYNTLVFSFGSAYSEKLAGQHRDPGVDLLEDMCGDGVGSQWRFEESRYGA